MPKRAISTIAGKLTVTLRHHIADKKPIICYVVVETIVSRCRSIATPHTLVHYCFHRPPVIKDNRDVSRLLRVHIPLCSLTPPIPLSDNIVYFYTTARYLGDTFWSDKDETLRMICDILSGKSSVIRELTISG